MNRTDFVTIQATPFLCGAVRRGAFPSSRAAPGFWTLSSKRRSCALASYDTQIEARYIHVQTFEFYAALYTTLKDMQLRMLCIKCEASWREAFDSQRSSVLDDTRVVCKFRKLYDIVVSTLPMVPVWPTTTRVIVLLISKRIDKDE